KAKKKSIVLCILDGFGLREKKRGNAIFLASTPNIDRLLRNYPNSTLKTFGKEVGLPENQMGNSEVGHMHIGAGRIIQSMLPRIDDAISSGDLINNDDLLEILSDTKLRGGETHIAGLISDGGVHGHARHLKSLMKVASKKSSKVNLHLFSDGRDVETKTSLNDLKNLISELPSNVTIATLMGRYYSMDRDKRWDRTQKAYDAIANGVGKNYRDPLKAIKDSHDNGVTDEFIEPVIFSEYNGIRGIEDSLIFCNFRADRARQILHSLTDENFISFSRPNGKMFNKAVGMIEYDTDFKRKFNVLFEKQDIKNGLGEWVSRNGLKQFRIAETEKYPHVTYFLNGGSEYEYEGEERFLVQSPQVNGYEQKPQMSAEEVCNNLISALERNYFDLLIVNFANPDMVGHTGSLSAARVAVETVDEMLGKICTCLDSVGGEALIISDHGNCEQMYIGDTESPHTYHTLNPVPCILYSDRENVSISSGSLIDIAPTILELLGKDKPWQMTGKSLLHLKH
ncbi:2,3-bisphosphoglycerate-independent phosphoglycerate mutase, partial [Paracoccaceae bacterium]|nr:2,3-bisphosphoglycerate-independent phosphoglycerate mutase [Paracoccaceae bacterium]